MKLKLILLFMATAFLWPAVGAEAAITCTISSPGFTAGYDPVVATTDIIQTYLTLSCTRLGTDPATQAYTATNNNGLHRSGGWNRARLGATTSYVNYDTYRDSACTTKWQNFPPADNFTGTINFGAATSVSTQVNFWGCIPASQTGLPAGIYSDTVTMTLTYGASTATGTFNAIIYMSATCTLTTAPGNVAFTYTSFQIAAAAASTAFKVTCTSPLPYSMALDATAGTIPAVNLAYTLALSAASSIGTGAAQAFTINGNMAAGQSGTCNLASCSGTQARTLTITY